MKKIIFGYKRVTFKGINYVCPDLDVRSFGLY